MTCFAFAYLIFVDLLAVLSTLFSCALQERVLAISVAHTCTEGNVRATEN
jgi:hypothetical protein